ncbi:hypothetical protein V5O39_09970 [Pseudomonas parakoreensis]|jgi:hypothetical protein
MTVRAVTLGTGTIGSQGTGDGRRRTMAQKNLFKQLRQRFERECGRSEGRQGFVWRRHLKLQTNYWREQQRTNIQPTD